MIPAIPGKVKVASKIVNIPINISKFAINAMLATNPKILYLYNINKITKTNPINKDLIPDFIESSPKSGPTVLSSTTTNGVGRAPERRSSARSVALKSKITRYHSVSSCNWLINIWSTYYFSIKNDR